MTRKTLSGIFYIILPIILILGIYGSQNSYELTGYYKLYNIKNSNDGLTLSVDNYTYKQGQIIHLAGKANHYNEGGKINIRITDHSKNTVANFDSLLDRYGIFKYSFDIPTTFSNGKYLLDAHYIGGSYTKPVIIGISISDNSNGMAYILIPNGASSQANNLNFDPQTINVTQGTKIIWINNDNAVHTLYSGDINDDGTLHLTNHFIGGYITPGSSFVISPSPGKYDYFCKIHPWLGGSITVKPNPLPLSKPVKPDTVTAKTPLQPNTVTTKSNATTTKITKPSVTSKPFPVSNNVLSTIWKERKDLQKLYPEVAHGHMGNLTKWATATGWNQDTRLSALIPPGKVPSYLNNVLLTIWKERKDLQKLYPEVSHGNLNNLIKWATSKGWNEDKRLSVLTPPTKVPKH